jgi:diguanylate cyclase (GGDEF)-like protein
VAIIPGTPSENESLIIVPLSTDGTVLGTLNVGRMGGPEAYFSATEYEIARLFASQASIALVNAESHRAIATQAETDALTGLRNRRGFDDRMAGLMAGPSAEPSVLVMLDLDGLKEFNDRQGHPAGDEVLRAVARAISASVRGDDRVYRLGGDEFAILMPLTSHRVGMQVAGRIREAIAALDSGGGSCSDGHLGVAACPGGRRGPVRTRQRRGRRPLSGEARRGQSPGRCGAPRRLTRHQWTTSTSASSSRGCNRPRPPRILGSGEPRKRVTSAARCAVRLQARRVHLPVTRRGLPRRGGLSTRTWCQPGPDARRCLVHVSG